MSNFTTTTGFRSKNNGVFARPSDSVSVERVYTKSGPYGTTMVAVCSDGRYRVCHVNLFENIEDARDLYRSLKKVEGSNLTVRFVASGNSSSDRYFCKLV